MQGLKTRDENVKASARREHTGGAPQISLSLMAFMIFRPVEPAKSITSIRKIFKAHHAELNILRSRRLPFEGMSGLEEVYILSQMERGVHESVFSAKWTIEGESRNPERPMIILRMESKTDDHNEALCMWDAVLENFTSIQAWNAKMKGGR